MGYSPPGCSAHAEYRSELPFPTPSDLPYPGIELAFLVSPASAGRFFTSAPPGKPWVHVQTYYGVMPFLLDAQRAFCICADREVFLHLSSGHFISLL